MYEVFCDDPSDVAEVEMNMSPDVVDVAGVGFYDVTWEG